ncbi:DUF2304 family protein [Corynebacterium poyangense]|uniref:DUF2304 family protein n=1 Tax=Corynebacterium poyangense TaxID=2684405 RepID=A0A7H0SLR6_9CORY|nr:DUF2304 domain-containing protein [Corynebacterium poyangense]MBZ8177597.1 DUF2304 family protein [Corynebacterium poyangense]QNQ89491.1 DUF2304 family protein [Corynebacterium poyangense]
MTATLIQILLLLAIIVLAVYFISNRRKARAKAGVKLGFIIFLCASVWAILRPDDLTVIANWLGVDRGTDLLLYATILAFFFVIISSYLRFRELELRYARLARAVALQNAIPPHPDTNPQEGDKP